jgi:hypothetical protein
MTTDPATEWPGPSSAPTGRGSPAEANPWLTLADSPIRLSGSPAIDTELGTVEHPDAILCRTNVGTMLEVMDLLTAGRPVALVGGGDALRNLARAARDLKAGKRTAHPELMLFETWGDLQEYAEYDPSGRDLQPLVDLVDEYGADVILNAVDRLSDERTAEIAVSTAHKAKGREWRSVRIGEDFTEPLDPKETDAGGDLLPGPINDAEARLAYVAVTRAQHHLDLEGLSWIHHHRDGNPSNAIPALSLPPRPAGTPSDQRPAEQPTPDRGLEQRGGRLPAGAPGSRHVPDSAAGGRFTGCEPAGRRPIR